jgi:hypothetical protein
MLASTIHGVLRTTTQRSQKELCVVESSDLFRNLSSRLHNFPKSRLVLGPVVGVIFDMDGTLTEPGAIDFKAIYTRIGVTR